jgi:hypothetical protein
MTRFKNVPWKGFVTTPDTPKTSPLKIIKDISENHSNHL